MSASAADPLAGLLDALAEKVADLVVARLTAGTQAGTVDQCGSPLGRRRHIAAVRKRVGTGVAGAAIVGRRHLLTREALQEELGTASMKPRKANGAAVAVEPVDAMAELREKYGLERRAS